jgi:metal-responsive CopG/Arc/MetJ family transcriptional regulator
VKIRVSLPRHLIEVVDETAERRGTTRSGLLERLLEAELVRERTRRYLDRFGWDVVDDAASWRVYQRRCMVEEYADDEW